MNIAYFEKSLMEHLGEDARKNFALIGLSNTNIRQFGGYSFIEITGEFDSSKCTAVLTAEQANAKITELFVPEHYISNDTIFQASLNAKIADGTVNLDALDESLAISDQYRWLQQQNVRGIGTTQPPAPFAEAL